MNEYSEVESIVDVSELMGAEVHLVMNLWGRQSTARVGSKSGKKPGDRVRIHFHKKKIYLFDKETEMRL